MLQKLHVKKVTKHIFTESQKATNFLFVKINYCTFPDSKEALDNFSGISFFWLFQASVTAINITQIINQSNTYAI